MKTSSVKKILVVNIFGIGDVLFSTPLLRDIKETFPRVQLTYLANRRGAEVLSQNPCVNRILIYERDEFYEVFKRSKISYVQKILELAQTIRNEHCDLAFDLSLNSGMNFLLWFSGIRDIVGYNYKKRGFFLTKSLPLSGFETQHVVDYYLDLGKVIGCQGKARRLEMPVAIEDMNWVEGFLRDHQLKKKDRVIAFFPGGGASWGKDSGYKQWPVENYGALINKVIEKFSAKVILLGDSKDHALCQEILRQKPASVIDASGQATLLQTCALLSRCALAVMNDGGPLHIAVAARIPTVSVFGPVNETIYGPYPAEGHAVATTGIICRPCYRYFRRAQCSHVHCLKKIKLEDVYQKVEQFLSPKTEKVHTR